MITKALEQYAESYTTPESPLLHMIHRETYLKTPYPNMLSGHLQGSLLRMISLMIRPARILEIGTFTGYSAICLSEGLGPEGLLYSIEINPEMEEMISANFGESGKGARLKLFTGDALEIILGLKEIFDLVFIDADKAFYCDYYNAVFEKVRGGGFILADNVLWGGKVVQCPVPSDRETQGIIRFNEMVKNDGRVEQLCLPVRDGLMIIRKL